MKKTIYILVTALLILGVTGCSDDFLSASSTEKQEAGAPAYEGAILANLASTITHRITTINLESK